MARGWVARGWEARREKADPGTVGSGEEGEARGWVKYERAEGWAAVRLWGWAGAGVAAVGRAAAERRPPTLEAGRRGRQAPGCLGKGAVAGGPGRATAWGMGRVMEKQQAKVRASG